MRWTVVYQVKYSEIWCANECAWIEHVVMVDASTAHEARRIAREQLRNAPRIIRGRHVSTSKGA